MTSELLCSLQDLEQKIRDGTLLSNRHYLHKNKEFYPALQMMYSSNNTLLDDLKMINRLKNILPVTGKELEQQMYLEDVILPQVTIQWLRKTLGLWRHEAESLLLKQEDAHSGREKENDSPAPEPTDQQNSGKFQKIEHALLAAKWCQTWPLKGKVTLPALTLMGRSEQLAIGKAHAGEEEDDGAERLFDFNFEYQSDYNRFSEEFMDKGYKVDGSFKHCD
ncbi:uncharacterized protein LOC130202303 isoform X1 [Pseudoliparis swirei]|uniref:uncharacterized protein LOC130202303 isoform X1 n=3 Tax=Pseudoliparis swirei TaxID=2059687 RepID=UPI0024BE532E|nr:uncharacterized protein LOC130202303 isoform X1 [Pseudoliparis swirei]